MEGFKILGSLLVVLVMVGTLSNVAQGLNIAHIRAELARGGRHVCPYCWACVHSWNCNRPCRPNYRDLCPLCAYRFHCSSTCVGLCLTPETPAPTNTPQPTSPPTTLPPTTTPRPTTQAPTTPAPEENPCSPNPCFADGNCQASPGSTGGYRCSCPPDLEGCSDDAMNLLQEYDYDRHGDSEKYVAATNPFTALEFKSIYEETFEELRASGLPGIHNGMQDAVRHALVNYRWTQAENAADAKMFADAHERSSPNPYRELVMDLHNNDQGRQLAQDPANAGRDPLEVVLEAYHDGTLQREPNPNHPIGQDQFSDEYN